MGKRNRGIEQDAIASPSATPAKLLVPSSKNHLKRHDTEEEPSVQPESHASTSVQVDRKKKKKGRKSVMKVEVEKSVAEEDESDDDDEV